MAKPRAPDHITPDILLQAYTIGLFPMSESADDPSLFWVDPKERGIFPLDGLIISKSLAKSIRSDRFEVCVDQDFHGVIDGCAATAGPERDNTWINTRIRDLYGALFQQGFVHTVEVYKDNQLVGGLYGVSIGAAFFGESMFHRAPDASKVALAHLVARLRLGGFTLLDTQFVTPHLQTLGAIEIPRETYHAMLEEAVTREANFYCWPRGISVRGSTALDILNEQKSPISLMGL